MFEMRDSTMLPLLKGVSRSFYLSLRLLPPVMRRAAALGYLLARTSDTLADTDAIATAQRLDCLHGFQRAMTGDRCPTWPNELMLVTANPHESLLLRHSQALIDQLTEMPAAEAQLIREVVAIITSGQSLDLSRFATATRDHPVVLANAAELDDYTWRVAGCVGAFWTQLGQLTLAEQFACAPANELMDQAIHYGMGLQLVNILRDLPADLQSGRCYLPVTDPHDRSSLIAAHREWLERAECGIDDGFRYADHLQSRRLRAASVLPAMIAQQTIDLMRGATWKQLEHRIKVPRSHVYHAMLRALVGS